MTDPDDFNPLSIMDRDTALRLIGNWRGSLSAHGRGQVIDGKWTYHDLDHVPLVRLQRRDLYGRASYWLLSELSPDDLEVAYGLSLYPGAKPRIENIFLKVICDKTLMMGPAQPDRDFMPDCSLFEAYSKALLAHTLDLRNSALKGKSGAEDAT